MKTVVLQTYRRENIPPWIARTLATVRPWAERCGFDYELWDDRIFDFCGTDYLAQVGDNKRSITNLARLELIRDAHRRGYDRAIWLDADMFIFRPDALRIDLTEGYAVARETWITLKRDEVVVRPGVNNSALVFIAGEPDLDFLILATRHVAAHRTITNNLQVGGYLLNGLQRSLAFQTIETVGMLSPLVLQALADGNERIVRLSGGRHKTPIYAANICGSEHYPRPVSLTTTMRAMDLLSETGGKIVNRYARKVEPATAP